MEQHRQANSSKNQKIVLLGGPIQRAINQNGRFDHRLKTIIIALSDVLEKSGYKVLSAHIDEGFGENIPNSSAKITKRDYCWMQLCDVYIALFVPNEQGEQIRSDGTHIEIGWASAMAKPIVLIGEDMPNEQNSHLIRGLNAIANVRFIELEKIISDPVIINTILFDLFQ